MTLRKREFISQPMFDNRDFGDNIQTGFDSAPDVIRHTRRDEQSERLFREQLSHNTVRKMGAHALDVISDFDAVIGGIRVNKARAKNKHVKDEV